MTLQDDLRKIMVLGGPYRTAEVWTAWETRQSANEGSERLVAHLEAYGFSARVGKAYCEPFAGTENRIIIVSRGGDWYDVWVALCAPNKPPSSNRGVTKNV